MGLRDRKKARTRDAISGAAIVLGHENQMRIAAGGTADDLAGEALAEADHAFALRRTGLAPYRDAR